MAAAEADRQLVVFSLHGERYAVPIGSVREIIRYTRPTPVPATSSLIQGMINLRGRVLPVVDLSTRLGRQLQVDARTRILVLEVANGTVGLVVDTVEGVRRIPGSRIAPLPVATAGDGLGHEIAAIDDQLIVLVDPERALGAVLPEREPEPASEPEREPEREAEADVRPDVQALSHPRDAAPPEARAVRRKKPTA
jgi:purine-binding chemotaxis protein CheW